MVISNKIIKINPKKHELSVLNGLSTQLKNEVDLLNSEAGKLRSETSKLTELSETLKEDNNDISIELSRVSEDISNKKVEIKNLNKEIDALPFKNKKDVLEFKNELDDMKFYKETLLSEIKKSKEDYKKIELNIRDIKTIEQEKTDKIDNLKLEISNLGGKYSSNKLDYKKDLDHIANKKNSADIDLVKTKDERKSLLLETKTLKEEITNYIEIIEKNKDAKLEEVKLNKSLKSNSKKLEKLSLEIKELESKSLGLSTILKKKTTAEETLSKVNSLIGSKKNDLEEIEINIKQIKNQNKEIEENKSKLFEIENLKDIAESKKALLTLEISSLEKELTKNKNNLNNLDKAKIEYNITKSKADSEISKIDNKKEEILKLIMINKKHLKTKEVANFVKEIENGLQ